MNPHANATARAHEHSRPTVDTRSRALGVSQSRTPAAIFDGVWADAVATNGERAANDALRLELPPLVLEIDGEPWTLRCDGDGIVVDRRRDEHAPMIAMDCDAFGDWVDERRTALGLVVGARVVGEPLANATFCAWDPVVRSQLDGRGVYQPGDIALVSRDGSPLDLDQRFRIGDRDDEAAHFLANAGFLVLEGLFNTDEIDAIDADLARAVAHAEPNDGSSWWAATSAGERYPCRILNFAQQSLALRELFSDDRYTAIGDLLADGHRPGDPFGEHFSDVTAEGLVKKVDSVEGLVCLPWHKDCDRGGHSIFCSGLTIGICLTPADEAHGGLDVMAGSHRSNIARAQVDKGLDLPVVRLQAKRGDLSVHMSCALHRSTHPKSLERRVAYTGFALPSREGEQSIAPSQDRLRHERAAIGDQSRGANLFVSDEASA